MHTHKHTPAHTHTPYTHLHTFTSTPAQIHRELFTLMDGGEVALDWADPWEEEEEEEDIPVLLILPGITGKHHLHGS